MQGNFINHLNIFLAPLAGFVLILMDYQNKRHTDATQRRLMTLSISFMLAEIVSELCFKALEGSPGIFINISCWFLNTVYFLFQFLAFGCLFLFLDYSTHGNNQRLKKLAVIVAAIWVVNLALLIINLFNGFIFTVTSDNFYLKSDLFAVMLFVYYFLLLLTIIDVLISHNQISRKIFILVVVSAVPSILGSMADVFFENSHLLIPCFYISIIFAYFFVVSESSQTDGLTGIRNRRSCDEYLISLERNARRKEYSFIMIDLDKFKLINDTLGHAQGDVALRDAAEILRASVRRTDFVGRYGGDEFVVFAATKETDKIMDNITRKFDEFNAKRIRHFTLELSCGGGLYTPEDPRTPQEFLSYVDELMYAKKMERRR